MNLTTVKKGYLDPCLYKLLSASRDKITCDFYLIKCTADEVRESDFIKLISDLILIYTLRKSEYDAIDPINSRRILRDARIKFKQNSKSGEIGELILFALLESERNATQLLNKMALKTSGNMPYHGLDAIHLGIYEEEIRLYYGESKIWKDLKAAIQDAVNGLSEFQQNQKRKDLEINLISNNIDKSKFKEYTEEVLALLDPYNGDKGNLREVYSIFIGFNWNSLENFDLNKLDDIEKFLQECLSKHSKSIADRCKKQATSTKINKIFEFFFIPFIDIEEIERKFREEIS